MAIISKTVRPKRSNNATVGPTGYGLTVGRGTPGVAGGGGSVVWLANKPVTHATVMTDIDLSQAVPSGAPTERAIVGAPGWTVISDRNEAGTGSNWSKVTDESGSVSSPDAWRLHYYPGVFDGGVPGSGPTGKNFGNIGFAFGGNKTEVYLCLRMKYNSTFEWHTVSTKHLRFAPPSGGYLLVQAKLNSKWMRAESNALGIGYEPQINTEPVRGSWMTQEVYIKGGNPGIVKIWVDGELRTSYENLQVDAIFSSFSIDGQMGGGGSTTTLDSYKWIDHIHLSTL